MKKRTLKPYDFSLIIVYIALCLFGLVMIFSASMVTSVQVLEYDYDHFFKSQLRNILIGFFLFFVAAVIPYKFYKNKLVLKLIFFGTIAALFAVKIIGVEVNGAKSWLDLYVMNVQPSEFAKLAVILYLASVYSKKQSYINDMNRAIMPPLIMLVLLAGLVILEPDFGTGMIILATGGSVILCSGMSGKNIFKILSLCALSIGGIITYLYVTTGSVFTGEKGSRITTYLDPFAYAQGDGYQTVNSLLAIGSGGISGLGLGKSVQKLGYLPEPHTDFIMAIISEELGILGVSIVLLGIFYIVFKGFYIALKIHDRMGAMIAVGISSMIGFQSFINLGGVTNLIPLTGVPLPFISYGGTSILLLSISMGILVNISMSMRSYERKKKKGHTSHSSNERSYENHA
ncbi:cell division protein FtsW [Bacillus coahuilensis m2-6]|uniref:FtsW/RodA/SpoVE family cell cycle protein n=1 Tax=Bacillus coahuilensis TaxID=408580 RepID=UPI00075041EF|nr:FtsW/RodA/SpoVE family cell cycle protein [Bacillus coahuilensis]KUP08810.1 cell division protein FtsW [Bacillus coahuilensis m2-6]